MSSPVAELAPAKTSAQTLVNDFTLTVATANGSGSQSSNLVLMRSLFWMGIPVSGKNMFPSNIQGLPTWFTIRANKSGYLARHKETDILVCMNPETAVEDVKAVRAGAICIYDAPLRLNKLRNDLVFFEIPFAKLAASIPDTEARIRKLLANMCYVGVLAELLHIDPAEAEKAIAKQFKGKPDELSDLVGTMHKYTPITDKLKDKTGAEINLADKTYDELDKANMMPKVKKDHPELYKKKFKEKFGKEPKM